MRPVSPRMTSAKFTRDEMRRLISFAAADNKRPSKPELPTKAESKGIPSAAKKARDPRKGPGPSKLVYRLSRAWKKPIAWKPKPL